MEGNGPQRDSCDIDIIGCMIDICDVIDCMEDMRDIWQEDEPKRDDCDWDIDIIGTVMDCMANTGGICGCSAFAICCMLNDMLCELPF